MNTELLKICIKLLKTEKIHNGYPSKDPLLTTDEIKNKYNELRDFLEGKNNTYLEDIKEEFNKIINNSTLDELMGL